MVFRAQHDYVAVDNEGLTCAQCFKFSRMFNDSACQPHQLEDRATSNEQSLRSINVYVEARPASSHQWLQGLRSRHVCGEQYDRDLRPRSSLPRVSSAARCRIHAGCRQGVRKPGYTYLKVLKRAHILGTGRGDEVVKSHHIVGVQIHSVGLTPLDRPREGVEPACVGCHVVEKG